MKILIFGDNHFSTYSSIVRSRGVEFSKRLENQINSLNWAEQLAEDAGCSMVVCLGDFFDKSELTAEEITALQQVVWSSIPHIFLVGNHEGLTNDLSTSSAHLFKMIPDAHVLSQPTEMLVEDNINLLFIPYLLESDRPTLHKLITHSTKCTICFSHNDIKGINYGMFESKEGFSIDDITRSCRYFFNGHIHNYAEFAKNCFNVGNLTGQNFGEDAYRYSHQVAILDTVTMTVEWIENPYAYNFYKLEISSFDQFFTSCKAIKNNAVITVKAPEDLVEQLRSALENDSRIQEYRVITSSSSKAVDSMDVVELTSVNHLEQFYEYITHNVSSSDVMLAELAEVCR